MPRTHWIPTAMKIHPLLLPFAIACAAAACSHAKPVPAQQVLLLGEVHDNAAGHAPSGEAGTRSGEEVSTSGES